MKPVTSELPEIKLTLRHCSPSVPVAVPVTVTARPLRAVLTIRLVVEAFWRTRTWEPPDTLPLTGSTSVTSTKGSSGVDVVGVDVVVEGEVGLTMVEGVLPSVISIRSDRIYPVTEPSLT